MAATTRRSVRTGTVTLPPHGVDDGVAEDGASRAERHDWAGGAGQGEKGPRPYRIE